MSSVASINDAEILGCPQNQKNTRSILVERIPWVRLSTNGLLTDCSKRMNYLKAFCAKWSSFCPLLTVDKSPSSTMEDDSEMANEKEIGDSPRDEREEVNKLAQRETRRVNQWRRNLILVVRFQRCVQFLNGASNNPNRFWLPQH